MAARRGEGPLGIAEPVRRVMIGATRNWSRNVLLWNLAANPQNGPHTDNGGCTGCSGAITLDGDSATKNVAFYVVDAFFAVRAAGLGAGWLRARWNNWQVSPF